MEFLFSLSFFLALFLMSGLFFVRLSNFISRKIDKSKHDSTQSIIRKSANKDKLLNSISIIHSANSTNALNGALKDFYQSIKYHKVNNVNFFDKDLEELDTSIEKFAKHKSLKLYGMNLEKEAYRDYIHYLQKTSL